MNLREAAKQHEFSMEYFRLLAEVLPGATTLNQIRVAQFIGLCTARQETPPCHKEIAAALELPPATVSRAVSVFLDAGIISAIDDPNDGRKRYLLMNSDYPGSGTLDSQVKALLARYDPKD